MTTEAQFPIPLKKQASRAVWLSSVGAGFEYYDFVIYGMMAAPLSQLFSQMTNLGWHSLKPLPFLLWAIWPGQ